MYTGIFFHLVTTGWNFFISYHTWEFNQFIQNDVLRVGFFLSIVPNLMPTGLINIIFFSSTFMKRFVCPYSLGNGNYSNQDRDFAFRTIRKKIRWVIRSTSPFAASHGTEFERKCNLFFYFVIILANEQLTSNWTIRITRITNKIVFSQIYLFIW